MSLYRDQGIVLRTIRLGEADRIVTFITQDHGKVRAVAKGVRKTKSKFGGRLEPTSHIALQLYEGRELDIVTQAESIDSYRNIREDLDRMNHVTPLLEAVDQLAQEREPSPQLYRMLAGALKSLDEKDSPLIVPAFFFKLLASEGFRPVINQCVNCGETDRLVAFDIEEGGVLCHTHRQGMPISEECLALVQRILGGDLKSALNEETSSGTYEVERLATHSMEHHLERRLRSVHVMDNR